MEYIKNKQIQKHIESHLDEFASMFMAKVGKWSTNQFETFVLGQCTCHYLQEFDAKRLARITEKAMKQSNLSFLLAVQ